MGTILKSASYGGVDVGHWMAAEKLHTRQARGELRLVLQSHVEFVSREST